MQMFTDPSPNPFHPEPIGTVVDLMRKRAERMPDHLAYEFLVDGDDEIQRLTYQAVEQQARAIASILRETCDLGDRVLILHPPGLSYITAFLGCLYGGLIAVPAYPPRRNRSVGRILSQIKDAQPKMAVTTQGILKLLKPRILEFPELRTVQWLLSDRLDGSAPKTFTPEPLAAESLAFLQYTSGSTAEPKGVMITHRNILHNTGWMHRYLHPQPDSRAVIWLPPYHDMGLLSGILAPLFSGFPVTLMSPFHFLQRPLRWLKAISTRQASFSGGPSFAYELCLNKIKSEDLKTLDLSSWRVAFNGAEPIQAEVVRQFIKKFSPCGFKPEAFHPCYGMAEATLMVTWSQTQPRPLIQNIPHISPKPLVSSGQSLGDQAVAIVDESGKRCQDGQEGEIWVSGASVAAGYWNQPELTAEVFRAYLGENGPFLRTGDLGLLQGSELFVSGRLKDLLIINGVNYHPQDLEQEIVGCHPAIQPAGVVAVSMVNPPSDSTAEVLTVFVELKRQAVRNVEGFEDIVRAVRSILSQQFQLVVHHVLLLRPGQIPKTSSGKVQRYLCRAQFLAGTFEPLMHHAL